MEEKEPTFEAKKLYYALVDEGVPAKLELNDGYKTIDIAVPDAMINIEVDGGQHNFDSKQAISDLKRTYYSIKKGYFTIRIPNSLIRDYFDDTVNLIVEILKESRKQLDEEDLTY